MKAPAFWNSKGGGLARTLLTPLSWVQIAAVRRRLKHRGYQARLPVVCIGNAVMGGAGKTPTAMAIAKLLLERGHKPVFLSRGYGGKEAGPLTVDPETHTADAVGDEPLLLAQAAEVWISRDRALGAKAIEANSDATVIIMDDGFQNPSLDKDVSILVANGPFGIGNGAVFPAGPLREPWPDAVQRADLVLIIDKDEHGLGASTNIPVFSAELVPASEIGCEQGARVLAFAGIGMPEKFFDTANSLGLDVVATRSFPDHHSYSTADMMELRKQAGDANATLLTTEKDLIRLSSNERLGILTIPVTLALDDVTMLAELLEEKLAR